MEEGFDLRTHIRNPKNGRVEGIQPYRMFVRSDGSRIFERGGKRYYENGVEVKEEIAIAQPAPKPEPIQASPKIEKVQSAPKMEQPKVEKIESVEAGLKKS